MDDLRRLNLNLLVALDALLAERSVTRAAGRLGLSQSAMSAALGRLRQEFGDELLTRAPEGMRATPRALALEDRVRTILRQVRLLLDSRDEFQPTSTERLFRIAMLDGIDMVLLPPLLAICRSEASKVRLEIVAFDRERYASDLDADRVDLAIGLYMTGQTHHKQRLLFREAYVVLFNETLLGIEPPVGLDDYVRFPHVTTRYASATGGAVDEALANAGRTRQIVALTPRFLVVPEIVRTSAVFATMGGRLARICAARYGLTVSPTPLEVPPYPVNMVWHTSYDGDPGHRWLRTRLIEIADRSRAGGPAVPAVGYDLG